MRPDEKDPTYSKPSFLHERVKGVEQSQTQDKKEIFAKLKSQEI